MPKPHPDKNKVHAFGKDGRWSIFYASGERGLVVRADGKGGALARGWYRRDNQTSEQVGPFSCMNKARYL